MIASMHEVTPLSLFFFSKSGETAEFIAQTNHDVTILEMKPAILTDMVVTNMIPNMERLHQQQIKIVTNATVSKINENAVSYKNADGDEIAIPASTVVSAFGYKAYNPLENVAKENCNEVYVIGSAVKAGNALTAIQDGYQAGLKL
ncbi:FAD-dependent oxidoreductase [Faecalibacillus intestinalis]|uniref:FAD-dependent oxidoreductase n=1 Tax=Faecalibacillus intestinalis TaxID=1982626 RepID=UPI0022E053E7|nr:FAD-dependent oxidoreductase [Faecalibacillus intestinalis]